MKKLSRSLRREPQASESELKNEAMKGKCKIKEMSQTLVVTHISWMIILLFCQKDSQNWSLIGIQVYPSLHHSSEEVINHQRIVLINLSHIVTTMVWMITPILIVDCKNLKRFQNMMKLIIRKNIWTSEVTIKGFLFKKKGLGWRWRWFWWWIICEYDSYDKCRCSKLVHQLALW